MQIVYKNKHPKIVPPIMDDSNTEVRGSNPKVN